MPAHRIPSRPSTPLTWVVRLVFGVVTVTSLAVTWSVVTQSEVAPEDTETSQATLVAPDGWVTFPQVAGLVDADYAEGRWYLADMRARRIHVIDTLGEYRLGFGRDGRGPGEFTAPSAIAVSGDRVYVVDLGIAVLQVFDREGEYIRAVDLRDSGCQPGTIVSLASVSEGVVALQRCAGPQGFEHKVLWVDAKYSVSLLDVPDPSGSGSGSTLPMATLASDGDFRVVFGDGQTGCFITFSPLGSTGSPRCPEYARAPMPEEFRRAAEKRLSNSRSPIRLSVPDSLPLFDMVTWTPALAMRHPTSVDSHVWIALEGEGEGLPTPEEGVQSIFRRGRYLGARDVMEGLALDLQQARR